MWKNGKAQAQDGYNDDLVMSFSMGMFLRDTSLRYKEQGENMTRAMLQGIGKSQDLLGPGQYSQHTGTNPTNPNEQYKIKDQHGNDIDLTWLI